MGSVATGGPLTLVHGLLTLYEGAKLDKARIDPSWPRLKSPLSKFKLPIILPKHGH